MKLGCSTYSFGSLFKSGEWTLDDFFKECVDLALDGVELDNRHIFLDPQFHMSPGRPSLEHGYWLGLKEKIRRTGLEVSCLTPATLFDKPEELKQRVEEIKKKYKKSIIKAIPVRSSDDITNGLSYSEIADIILFDAKAPSYMPPGGNALSFDWKLLQARSISTPWMLSGGLSASNIIEAIQTSNAPAVDVSSSVETRPGIKDPALIKEFITKARAA